MDHTAIKGLWAVCQQRIHLGRMVQPGRKPLLRGIIVRVVLLEAYLEILPGKPFRLCQEMAETIEDKVCFGTDVTRENHTI